MFYAKHIQWDRRVARLDDAVVPNDSVLLASKYHFAGDQDQHLARLVSQSKTVDFGVGDLSMPDPSRPPIRAALCDDDRS